ncbi:MAG TPA: DUF2934 domain-containing protein [Aurantimonas sp.]|jgi:hypothetical protein|nr:DUF2934 domain-containing protein [Aurantimonas sp.]
MSDLDEERVRAKAHALWEAENRPEGRAERHWVEAREIVALEDSAGSTLQPLDETTEDAVEPRLAAESHGDVPELTDLAEGQSAPSWQAAKETGASSLSTDDNSQRRKEGGRGRR